MAEQSLMKDGLGPAAIARIGNSLAQVIPHFNSRQFQRDAEQGLEPLELKARVHHLIGILHRHYDLPFKKLSRYLQDLPEIWDRGSATDNKAAFAAWPVIDYVAVHGLKYPREALQTLEKLTPLFTAEFAIRPFVQEHTELTYAQLLDWCEHPSDHVRRLASEGSRPRLPWGVRLPQFIRDPEPLKNILQKLKADESLYVRRSVANNLNDISKDNPAWMLELCETWLDDNNAHTNWIVKHALRSLIKAGDARAFLLLGYSSTSHDIKCQLTLDKKSLSLGESLAFSCKLSGGTCDQNLVVDYLIYFMKANGSLAPKVFKLKNIRWGEAAAVIIPKNHGFKPITTRRYYAGEHQLAIQVNGKEVARQSFYLHN